MGASTTPTRKKPTTKKKKRVPRIEKNIVPAGRQAIVETVAVLKPGEASPFPKCKFFICRNTVSVFKVAEHYCSHTCYYFDQKRKQATRKVMKGVIQLPKYSKTYAHSKFFEYLRMVEESHQPYFLQHGGTMMPVSHVQLPSVEGYASFLGVVWTIFTYWAKVYPEFNEVLHELKQFQKNYLVNNGVGGRYNPQVTKLILMNNHGMAEKKDSNVTNTLIGVVKEVYAQADKFEAEQDASPLDQLTP